MPKFDVEIPEYLDLIEATKKLVKCYDNSDMSGGMQALSEVRKALHAIEGTVEPEEVLADKVFGNN